ncbi:MAG: tail fiber domain-containing protein, partial [Bacteroidia bacterium]|nr:tail fiber domain-containing protein [Bacteroidia bacterium]
EAQAIYSVAIGNAVQAQSYSSTAIGRYNVGGGSATAWNANDPVFEIGIGSGPSSTANAITVQKDGDVGIGTTTPGARLHVANGNIRIGSLEEFSDGGSFIIQVNSNFAPETNATRSLGTSALRWTTVYATNGTINTSDRRDKQDIRELSYGIQDIMKLKPVSFSWKDQPEMGTKLGLIAQDVQEVISEVVLDKDWVINEQSGEKTEIEAERMGVFYSDLIPVLIKGMQEQQEIINAQTKRIEALEARLQTLEEE